MIGVLALDPTSLTLNVETSQLAASGHGAVLSQVIRESYDGDVGALRHTLSQIDEPSLQARASHLATCVWHEKRHYLDLLLTNYGAIRIRNYFTLYSNQNYLLSQAKRRGETLWAPFSVYACPTQRELRNLRDTWPDEIAANLVEANAFFAADQQSMLTGRGESVQCGGEAQFEALAWSYQIASMPLLLGNELALTAQKDIVLIGQDQIKYRWLEYLAKRLGVLPVYKTADGQFVDLSFVLPLVYACLQIRSYGQTSSVPKSRRSSIPSTRLFELASHLSDMKHKLHFGELQISESWDLVNKLCRAIWGRSASEEIAEDYSREEELLETWKSNDNLSKVVINAFADYHALRGTLLKRFFDSPDLVLDTTIFARDLLPKLQPLPIIVNSSGVYGDVPDDLTMIHGFYDDKKDRASGWWWAAYPHEWLDTSGDSITPKAVADWLNVASNMAPFAKLMLHGRAHRTVIGPELLSFEKRQAATGVTIECVAPFMYPKENPQEQMAVYYLLCGDRQVICDMCSRPMTKPDGRFLQAWLFRHNLSVVELIVGGFMQSGDDENAAQRRFMKDWSYWTCCDLCFSKLSGLPEFRRACDATFS